MSDGVGIHSQAGSSRASGLITKLDRIAPDVPQAIRFQKRDLILGWRSLRKEVALHDLEKQVGFGKDM